MACIVHMSVPTHHSSLQPLPFRCLPSLFFPCSHGRTSEHAAASWHHRVEPLLRHGHSAPRTTLSPTATMWCELPAHCADIGLHTGATRCSDSKLCVLPTGYTQCHQSTGQVQTGPTRTATSNLMSATLAGAATQLSFAQLLERCILLRASQPPPLPSPTLLLDAATQTIPHIAVSQDVSTQLPLAEFSLRCMHLQNPSGALVPPSTHDVFIPTCSRPIPLLLLDAAVQTPSPPNLPLTELLIRVRLLQRPFKSPRLTIGTLQCKQRITSTSR